MLPAGDVVVHDVLFDQEQGYSRREGAAGGGLETAGGVGLRLVWRAEALVVERLPGSASFPRSDGRIRRLFTLRPGEIGRYRANFRFTGHCPCTARWWYEDWLVHVGNGVIGPDAFLHHEPAHGVDHRVHLYGGLQRGRGLPRPKG